VRPANARILRQGDYRFEELNEVEQLVAPCHARIMPRHSVEAARGAQEIIARAQAEAKVIVARAAREAAQIRLQATAAGRAAATAELAARAVALRSRELTTAERSLDQQVQLAQLLAERVLGEELRLAPERIVALARQALNEARGARQICIEAHPEDAALLQQVLGSLSVHPGTVQLKADPDRERGHLRIVTDVGVLDAALGPQLDRLTAKLRETLTA
jgi:flagellar assembly protein FliH